MTVPRPDIPEARRTMEILLIEDNPADVRLTQEVFGRGNLRCRISVTEDGEAALEFLRRSGRYAAAPRPDLILLDLNLPRKDGLEVLTEIKSDAELRSTPVVVLTSSAAETDVASCYDLHANCYVVKPGDYTDFVAAIREIEAFWLQLARLPRAAA
ncbi:MAG: response regulator [Planctomycetes bacterium]|nr:response regulator [Planctomycetota bacterium]